MRRSVRAPRFHGWALAVAVVVSSIVAATPVHAASASLTLDDALQLAVAQSPQLAAQIALAQGANVGSVAAGALPDPKLKTTLGERSPPTPSSDSLRKDFHEWLKVGVSQEFPGGDKRELRTRRAELDAQRGLVDVEVQRAAVQREVAMAWIARHFADEAELKVADQINEAKLAVDAGKAQYRSASATQADVIALQSAVIDLENRRTEIALQARRAQITLARYIGADAERPLGAPPDLAHVPPAVAENMDADALPAVRAARAKEIVAAADADLEHEENWPDWMAELSYGWRGRAGAIVQTEPGHTVDPLTPYSQLISLEVEVSLPLFTSSRQEPRQAAKLKELDASRGLRENARRRQSAEVEGMVTEWEGARAQAKRIRDELIPLVVQRREAALAAYRGGTGTLAALLEARRGELAAQLALISQEQAAGKAWAWLAFAFPVADKS